MSGAAIVTAASGASGIAVSFIAQNPYGTAVTPADASAVYTIASNGTDMGDTTNTWLRGGLNSEVEIYATLASGTLTSGVTGAWQVPTSDLTWVRNRTINLVGSTSAGLSFQARKVVDGVALASWSVTLTAETT